jgi:hypothetical protein
MIVVSIFREGFGTCGSSNCDMVGFSGMLAEGRGEGRVLLGGWTARGGSGGVDSRSSFSTIIISNGVGRTGGDDTMFCDGVVTGGVGGFLEPRGPEAVARDVHNALLVMHSRAETDAQISGLALPEVGAVAIVVLADKKRFRSSLGPDLAQRLVHERDGRIFRDLD